MATEKQIVSISLNKKSVVVRNQKYNDSGIAEGEAIVGVINIDPDVTTVQKVAAYAKTRKWDLSGEPNRAGLITPVDMGPRDEPMTETKLGESRVLGSAGTTERASAEIKSEELEHERKEGE